MNASSSFSTDRLFGIAAFLISIGTFIVYIYEARLLQKQQYASALPYLELWNSGSSADYRLILVNNGIGPAFIKDVKIRYKGKEYNMDHAVFYEKVILPADTMDFTYSNIGAGRVIPPGQQIDLISVSNSEKDTRKLRKLFGEQAAKIEIVYESVYEERWKMLGMDRTSVKLDD